MGNGSVAKLQEISENRRSDEVKYKGVRKRKWGKWVSEIRLPNSRARIWLGSYDSAEKAARAFDAAMFCLRGRNAKFNFPDDPPEIPNGRSLSRDQIQEAAAKFANSERKSDSRVESPCPSETVSDGTVQSDHFMLDASFLDTLANTNMLDPDGFGYSGFDDFFGTTSGIPYSNFEEENMDYVFNHDSFLWNF